jgi:hypothetical protein
MESRGGISHGPGTPGWKWLGKHQVLATAPDWTQAEVGDLYDVPAVVRQSEEDDRPLWLVRLDEHHPRHDDLDSCSPRAPLADQLERESCGCDERAVHS